LPRPILRKNRILLAGTKNNYAPVEKSSNKTG